MTKKQILRKVWVVFSWVWLFKVTVEFLLGKADTFSTVCMFVCYSIWSLNLLVIVVCKVIEKVTNYKAYKQYEEGFKYLEAVHKARYKLYFTGTSKEVETYSEEIERYGNAMLNEGQNKVSNNKHSKTQTKKVQEILNQTRKLMTTTN